jgi:predicted enzyme related to lactoylglutathione lyase
MNQLSLSRLGQITLPAQDVERATAFWRDLLGAKFLFAAPGLAFFDLGGVRLMLGKPEKPEFAGNGAVLYFKVDDIDAAHRTLVGRGVKFVEPPHLVHRAADHDLWLAFLRDSEQNAVALMQEKRRS